jgi:hypothetical protein
MSSVSPSNEQLLHPDIIPGRSRPAFNLLFFLLSNTGPHRTPLETLLLDLSVVNTELFSLNPDPSFQFVPDPDPLNQADKVLENLSVFNGSDSFLHLSPLLKSATGYGS